MTKKELQAQIIELEGEVYQLKIYEELHLESKKKNKSLSDELSQLHQDCRDMHFKIEHLIQTIGQLYLDRESARKTCKHYKDRCIDDELPF